MSISRREFLKKSALITAFSTIIPQTRLFAFDSNFHYLRRDVSIYINRGGTIGCLINSDASVVVDSQFPDSAADCLIGIQEKRARNIDLLINSHHHGDHTGGNGIFRPSTNRIIAHEQVPKLQHLQNQMRRNNEEIVVADETYSTSWSEDFGRETVRLRHYGPAHTGGDSVITFEEANVVHMGDLVFNRVFPFIDEAGGANILNWISLLEETVRAHDSETIYIFGHGDPSKGVTGNFDDVLLMRDYLSALFEHVKKAYTEGQSRDEIVSIVSLDGFEDFISFGPRLSLRANLDVAYNQLVKEGED